MKTQKAVVGLTLLCTGLLSINSASAKNKYINIQVRNVRDSNISMQFNQRLSSNIKHASRLNYHIVIQEHHKAVSATFDNKKKAKLVQDIYEKGKYIGSIIVTMTQDIFLYHTKNTRFKVSYNGTLLCNQSKLRNGGNLDCVVY